MFGLLSKKPVRQRTLIPESGSKSYTRFHDKQATTRFATEPARPEIIAKEIRRPIPTPPRPVLVKPGKIDENAHLYADAKVSVRTLRKALPLRFAKMRASLDQAVAS